jgi:hypothetical protein
MDLTPRPARNVSRGDAGAAQRRKGFVGWKKEVSFGEE